MSRSAPAPSPATSSRTTCCPQIHGAIVSYSHRGSDEGPSADLVRRAAELIPGVLAERVRHGAHYASIKIAAEVKMSVALSQRSATYYGSHGGETWTGGTNVIVCPNLDMGNLLYHLYATRYPDAKKFTVMFGLQSRGVDLAMDCTPEDVRLSVKASVLRMYRFGVWKQTPKDTFFRRHRVLAINPGSTSTKISMYEGEQESFTAELQHTARRAGAVRGESASPTSSPSARRSSGTRSPSTASRWPTWTRFPLAAGCCARSPTAPIGSGRR